MRSGYDCCNVTEDDKERRVVRARPPRSEPPPNSTERPAEPLPDPERPKFIAAGSGKFGRTLPPGVESALHALGRLKRDEAATITFGELTLTVEHRYGLVVLVLPDGTRATATPEQAEQLAKVLLGTSTPRR